MSGWDRACPGYLAQWLPQFAPYDGDLAFELGLHEGDRVVSTPGSEVIALARAVGERGKIDAVDARDDVLVLCKERVAAAALEGRVVCRAAREAGYDAAVSVFELTDSADPVALVRGLREAIAPSGKVGLMVWGPPEPDDAERVFARAVDEIAPEIGASKDGLARDRASLAALCESAGLALLRHTVVSHAMVFNSAERFASALLSARKYGPTLRALGEPKVAAVLARFYERAGAEDEPISYAPAATIVIAALPGAEIELPHRPSVRAPIVTR